MCVLLACVCAASGSSISSAEEAAASRLSVALTAAPIWSSLSRLNVTACSGRVKLVRHHAGRSSVVLAEASAKADEEPANAENAVEGLHYTYN